MHEAIKLIVSCEYLTFFNNNINTEDIYGRKTNQIIEKSDNEFLKKCISLFTATLTYSIYRYQ
ncbi:putative PTS system IIA component [Ehrlichia ruminantium]|nr:putative PTS system IIA component [Ehrlichia ruminantium]